MSYTFHFQSLTLLLVLLLLCLSAFRQHIKPTLVEGTQCFWFPHKNRDISAAKVSSLSNLWADKGIIFRAFTGQQQQRRETWPSLLWLTNILCSCTLCLFCPWSPPSSQPPAMDSETPPNTHWKLGAPGSKSLKETAFTAMLSRWKGEKGRPERQNSFRILSLLVHNARYVLGVTSQHLIYGQIEEMGCCGSQCSGWGSTELVKSTPVSTFRFSLWICILSTPGNFVSAGWRGQSDQ